MTEKPQHFLPGDVVERTGESVPYCGVFHGAQYVVHEVADDGWVMLADVDVEFRPRGFKLISRPSTPRAEIIGGNG